MNNFKNKIKYFLSLLRYISLDKTLNLLGLYLSYLFSGRKVFFSKRFVPAFISVEPYNFCQLKCSECPVNQRKDQEKMYTDPKLIVKLVDELKHKLFHIIFYFQGEPTINKNLAKIIAYAHQSGIYTSTSTNGQLLDSDMARQLVEAGLDKLIVSVDGTTQQVYEQYRAGGRLDKALRGIEYVQEWKQKLGSPTPFVEIQFIVFKTNEHQIPEIKKMARELQANRLVLKSAQLYNFENGHRLLTSIDKYARYYRTQDGTYRIKNKLRNRCLRLWTGAVVNASGEVVPCCFDKNSSHSFGNASQKNFSEIWHNKKASGFRASILQNRKQYDMCRNCTSK
jgi:radical SAM protein with 4Fe4S-binding SPASM domain